jgi:hypothetical protein
LHAAFEHMADAHLAGDITHVDAVGLEGEGGGRATTESVET